MLLYSSLSPRSDIFDCNFERGDCDFGHLGDDPVEWRTISGETPTEDTGPDGDHTTGHGIRYTIYFTLLNRSKEKYLSSQQSVEYFAI